MSASRLRSYPLFFGVVCSVLQVLFHARQRATSTGDGQGRSLRMSVEEKERTSSLVGSEPQETDQLPFTILSHHG